MSDTGTRVLQEIRETTRSKPVGSCVYCGSTENLTDEHVVPFALGGNLILPKASCEACAKITSLFERRVTRGFMLPARTVAGLPTRRPKERPTSFGMEVGAPDDLRQVEFSVAGFPAFLQLPHFAKPGFFSGPPYKTGVVIDGIDTIHFGKDPRELAGEMGITSMRQTATIAATDFARMIAKIAYCSAIVEYGPLPLDGCPVLPFILGSADDGNVWVGSADFQTELERRGAHVVLYTVPMRSDANPKETILLSRVKLFANAGARGYEVIVHRTIAP